MLIALSLLQREATISLDRSVAIASTSTPEATGAFLIKDGLVWQWSSVPHSQGGDGLPQPAPYTLEPLYAATMDDMVVRLKYKGKTCRKRSVVYLDCTDLDVTLPEFLFRAKYRAEQGKWELLGGFKSFSTLATQDAVTFQLSADPRHTAGWTAWVEAVEAE